MATARITDARLRYHLFPSSDPLRPVRGGALAPRRGGGRAAAGGAGGIRHLVVRAAGAGLCGAERLDAGATAGALGTGGEARRLAGGQCGTGAARLAGP